MNSLTGTRVVDVHGHLVPDEVYDHVPAGISVVRRDETDKALVVDGVRGRFAPDALRNVATRQRAQAARGVDLSIVGPWIDVVKAATSTPVQVAWCRTLTDALSEAARGRRDLQFLAALPDLDGGAAAEELARAVELGAVGGLLSSNPQRDGLDADHFVALWTAAERLGVPIMLHPGYFQPPEHMTDYFLANSVGNPFETTLAVGRLIGADVPGRFPDVRLILCHAGGSFPVQYGRLDAAFRRWPRNREVRRRLPADLLRWFWYDTVLFSDEPTRYLLDLVGHDRVLAGTDCPFAMADYRPFEIPDALGLDTEAATAVLGGNALRLFRIGEDGQRPRATEAQRFDG
jgi:aminocarboxymuconate-semialdehyde decarboxylase